MLVLGSANVRAICLLLLMKLVLKFARDALGPKTRSSFLGKALSIETNLSEILNCRGLLPFSGVFKVKMLPLK